MRKSDLAAVIADRADLPVNKAEQALSAILEQIATALSRGESINLIGFGTFERRHRAARTGKNPQSGAPIEIGARNTVGFKPGKSLRDALN